MAMRGRRGPARRGRAGQGSGTPRHSDLPLPDYDHLAVHSVAQRIRSLTAGQVRQLLDYEWAHACRPAVTAMMQARLAELQAGATPTGGTGQDGPDRPGPAQRQEAPEKAGPPAFPPPHGVPSQPARPKADRQVP